MSLFPDNPKKIRARIRSYERSLRKEREEHGFINEGYGKRYLLGPLYMQMIKSRAAKHCPGTQAPLDDAS